jgi:hypothetical protein
VVLVPESALDGKARIRCNPHNYCLSSLQETQLAPGGRGSAKNPVMDSEGTMVVVKEQGVHGALQTEARRGGRNGLK